MAETFAWAVLYPLDKGFVCPGAAVGGTVQPTRQQAMKHFVAAWRTGDDDGLTVSKVWQRAYRRGWRLARVSITPALGYGGPAQ